MESHRLEKLDKYHIARYIGGGAGGDVWEGFDDTLKRKVAIKIVKTEMAGISPQDTETRARFQREAMLAAKLHHQNIVTVYDYKEYQKRPAIVMEYAPGRSLKDLLETDTHIDIGMVVNIISQLLDALSYCHKKEIVHRDIKPANIMLSDDYSIKVTDFGVARLESSEFTLTKAGSIIGTPSYMSPEQWRAQTADARSDLFSTGVILYEMLAGERPFAGNSLETIMQQVINEHPRMPSKLNARVPPAFDGVIKKALAKDPNKRYQTAEEFSAALKQAFEKSFLKQKTGISIWKNYRLLLAGSLAMLIAAGIIVSMIPDAINDITKMVTGRKPSRPPQDLTKSVRIPEGEFIMGSDKYTNERPQQKIHLDSYHMDKFLVTNKDFRQFIEATGYQTDAEKAGYGSVRFGYRWKKVPGANWKSPDGHTSIEAKENHPVTQVSYNDALAYCQWKGKDLPTEAQWEKAARGAQGNEYPWGNSEPDDTLANFGDIIGTTTPVDRYEKGKSPYGVYDMAGNVYQWCKDFWSTGERESKNPVGPSDGAEYVVKGGSFIVGVDNLRSAHRDRYKSDYSSYLFGFRCCAE